MGDRSARLAAVAAARKVTFHGGNAVLRTARKRRWCSARDDYPSPCPRTIEPGTQYVRSVMFPNHDASGYDKPVVHDTCLSCAGNYLYLDDLAEVATDPRYSPAGSEG